MPIPLDAIGSLLVILIHSEFRLYLVLLELSHLSVSSFDDKFSDEWRAGHAVHI